MNQETLQEKLHKMQKDRTYRLLTFDNEGGVKSMPELKGLSSYLILTGSEWFAKNGDQQMSSGEQSQSKVLFAQTNEKLFLPKADKTALYISTNHPAMSCCVFAYILICNSMIYAGFLGGVTTGKYYTIQLPLEENRCYCLLDLVMTEVARAFPDDVKKLRVFFNLGSNYDAGHETVFEE